MKKSKKIIGIAIIIILAADLFITYAGYHKNAIGRAVLNPSPNRSVAEFAKQLNDALAYHPWLGNDGILQNVYPVMQTFIALRPQNESDARLLVSVLEQWTPETGQMRTYVNLPRTYGVLWEVYGHEADYDKSVALYNRVLTYRPLDPESMYCLDALYTFKHDPRADDITRLLIATWGTSTDPLVCPLAPKQ